MAPFGKGEVIAVGIMPVYLKRVVEHFPVQMHDGNCVPIRYTGGNRCDDNYCVT